MDRMMRYLERILAWAVDHPDARLSALSMLSAEERHQIVRGWNAAHRP